MCKAADGRIVGLATPKTARGKGLRHGRKGTPVAKFGELGKTARPDFVIIIKVQSRFSRRPICPIGKCRMEEETTLSEHSLTKRGLAYLDSRRARQE